MQYSTLVVAALAGLSASMEGPRDVQVVQVLVRGITTIQADSNSIKRAALVEKRDTSACVSAASQFTKDVNTNDLPTLPASLSSEILSYQLTNTINDVCSPSFTGSLSSAYASYTKEASSFLSKNEGAIKSFYSACSDIPLFSSAISAIGGECTEALAQITGGSSSGGSSNNDDDDKGAAPAIAVPVFGVALVAGLVGFVL